MSWKTIKLQTLFFLLPLCLSAQVTTFPFYEGFESSVPPSGWSEEGNVSWYAETGCTLSDLINRAHSGNKNAFNFAGVGRVAKLITPQLDISSLSVPELSFWHFQIPMDGVKQDELRVYYRTSAGGEWTLIPGQEYTNDISYWKGELSIPLPNPSDDYYICFEGSFNNGDGIGIDDVSVIDNIPISATISDDAKTNLSQYAQLNIKGDLTLTGSLTQLQIDGSVNINSSIIIGTNSRLVVSESGNLFVTGNFDNTDNGYFNLYGSLTVEGESIFNYLSRVSTIHSTGSLITNSTNNRSIVCEVQVPDDRWHYISSPVLGDIIDESWMTANDMSQPGDIPYQFFMWDEPSSYWLIYGDDLFNDYFFETGKAYCIDNTDASYTYTFDGEVSTSNINVGATYNEGMGNGFNLLGNPYTSAIGITSDAASETNFLADNASKLDPEYGAIYLWQEQDNYTSGENDYAVICNTGFSGTGNGTILNQDYIKKGQGFFIKVEMPQNILFDKDSRYHADVDFLKKSGNREGKETWPGMELFVNGGDSLRNSTVIAFNDDMTLDLDPTYDIAKLKGNKNIALYTSFPNGGESIELAVQALPINNLHEFIIPVGIDIIFPGSYTFSLQHELMENYHIYLEDKSNGAKTNLKYESYTTVITGNESQRFFIHFKDGTGVEEEIESEESLYIYSYQNSVTIINNLHIKGDIDIYDILGNIESNYNLDGSQQQHINLNLPTGVYIVRISTDTGDNISKKVIISK